MISSAKKNCVLGLGLLVFGCVSAQENPQPDSSFSELSMQGLQNAKAYYVQELDALVREKKDLIQKGIEDGERLLPGADPKVVPEILIRLADLYYHQEKEAFLDHMKAYEDSLELRRKAGSGSPPSEPALVFQKAIQYYQRIIDAFPESDLVDDAVYYRAFLCEEMGENAKANALYVQLAESFPQSNYLPEVYMRLGEYHFNPPANDMGQAIGFYRKVIQYQNSPRYYEALYKLGWSYYRLNQYAEAISYFTTLVEQFTALEKYQAKIGVDLRNEALDYIAVCFVDFGGAGKANEYLHKIGHPEWGQAVLKKMGDLYRIHKEEFHAAIAAYDTLLNYSSFYPDAPQIQKSIADCYRALGDQAKLFETRQKLFSNCRIGSAWWNQNQDDKSRLQAYKLGEQALRDNIFDLIKKAESRRSEALYRQVADMARNYLESFPEDLNALLIRWNLALILDSKLHQYREALQEYLTISLVYDNETYETFAKEKGLATIQDAALNAMVVADTLVQREYKRASQKPSGETAKIGEKNPIQLTDTERWLIMACDNYIKLFPFDAKTPTVLVNTGALFYTHNQFNEALRYFKTLTKNFPQSEQVKNVQLYILESYFGKEDFESTENLSKKLMGENLPETEKEIVKKRLAEAIFLRAQTFSEQGQSQKAAAEYLRMALEVPTSDFADRAVFNAGRENEKILDVAASIRAYEMLRTSYAGSILLPDALNNLVINYASAGDYTSAAARSEELSRVLKDSAEAGTAYYNAFVYYIKAENWGKAAETGNAYSIRYARVPNAPLVHFKTAECYVRLKEDIRAARLFMELSTRFPNAPLGVDACFRAGNLYLANDSLSSAEKAFYQAYLCHESLVRKGLEGNGFFAAEGLFQASILLEKRCPPVSQKLLRQLVEQYAKVAAFQGERMPESLYRIGEVHERFAENGAAQELHSLDPTAKVVKQKEINEKTIWFFKQALSSYLAAVRVMDKWIQETDSSRGKNAPDSLRTLTRRWNEKSKSKAAEILFRMAEINARTIVELLDAPIPREIGEMAGLEYRNQLLLKAIAPLVLVVVDAHNRNVIVSDSLGCKASWADSSRARMLSQLGLLASEYEKLAFETLNGFKGRLVQYRRSSRKENAPLPSGFVDEMVNFLELSKSYSQNACAFRKDELLRAVRLNLPPDGVAAEKQAMVGFALRMADSLDVLCRAGAEDREWARRVFESQGDPKFEEMLSVFEDNVYFIHEKTKTVLEQAYAVHAELSDPVPAGGWLGIRLIQLDPEKYSKQLGIPVDELMLQPDSTWLCSFAEQNGWEKSDFQPKSWIPFTGTFRPDTALNTNRISDGLFIRKEFFVPGLPVSGEVELPADSSITLFVNGVFFIGNPKPDTEVLKQVFRGGRNILSIRCGRAALKDWKVRIFIRFLPDRVLPREK